MTKSYFDYKAVLFVLFDLSRPATFFQATGEMTVNVKYLMNEVATLNNNPKILKFLLGTNADKAGRTFDRLDAEKYAHENAMQYLEISCLDTNQIDKVVREAITIVCQNINSSGFYPWDEKKHWDRYGIKVMGDREIIDNPPALPAPKQEPPKQAAPMYGAARRKDPVPETKPQP